MTAAQFIGRSLIVQIATLRRGTSIELHLRVQPQHDNDPRVDRWLYGNERAYPPVPPAWPRPDVDPWRESSFSGPLPASVKGKSPESCPSCGARTDEANYCGQCAAPLDPVEALAASLTARAGAVAALSPTAGADVAALVDRYAKPFEAGRAELLQFVKADFTESARARFVRGEPATVTPGLTLAVAQDIHQSVAATGRVRPEQIENAELLLRGAPLHFGYWGPFKALLKSVPIEDMSDAYADAIARLSSKDWSRPCPPTVGIEDIGFLSEFFPAASPDTLRYMARRARRDLATLAEQSPDAYARVASRMILSWDRSLSRNSFAPAYVMLGARGTLDSHGENVVVVPDMSRRRDAHPVIWDERPQLVQQIFDNVRNSVEAQTWSFQVLESLGQVPTITGDHLKLALLSRYPVLNQAASAALSSRPGQWGSLTAVHWAAFLRNGEDADIVGILGALSAGTVGQAPIEGARDFLRSGVPATRTRMLAVALMFLSATQTSANQRTIVDGRADAVAVAAVISQSATKYKKLWSPVIKGLDVEQLEYVRDALPDTVSRSLQKSIDELLLRKRAERTYPDDAVNWIASENPLQSKLGWQILERGYYGFAELVEQLPEWIADERPDSSILERVIDQVFERATGDDVPRLSDAVQEALKRGADGGSLLALSAKTPVGRAVFWRALSKTPRKRLEALLKTERDAIRVMGDDINADQLEAATPQQCRFVVRYLADNPGRIARDIAFGVTAATSPEPALQAEAIKQLHNNAQLSQVWLALAESARPKAQVAARGYIAALTDGPEFTDSIVRCWDSEVPAVQDTGTALLRERLERSEDRSVWTALAESDDLRILKVLAAEPHLSESVDPRVLSHFDRRVMHTHGRGTRQTKEKVKARLEATDVDSDPATEDRVATLLDLARGETLKDKEWALEKLAELALSGLVIDGLEVSLVTKGDGT